MSQTAILGSFDITGSTRRLDVSVQIEPLA